MSEDYFVKTLCNHSNSRWLHGNQILNDVICVFLRMYGMVVVVGFLLRFSHIIMYVHITKYLDTSSCIFKLKKDITLPVCVCVCLCVFVCVWCVCVHVSGHLYCKWSNTHIIMTLALTVDNVGDINVACGLTDHQPIILVLEECCVQGSSSMTLSSLVTPFSSATIIIHSQATLICMLVYS